MYQSDVIARTPDQWFQVNLYNGAERKEKKVCANPLKVRASIYSHSSGYCSYCAGNWIAIDRLHNVTESDRMTYERRIKISFQ